jgi:hypothetical protein
MSIVQGIGFVELRRNMAKSFDDSELQELCYDLGIEMGNIPGPELRLKVIQIIEYCQRRGPMLFDLIAYCEQERAHIQWRQLIQAQATTIDTVDQCIAHREQLYKDAKDVQMVHAMVPSKQDEGYWDILIYLVQHQSEKLIDVAYAEFFLGRYWGNKIFKAVNEDNFVGILISAYGPTLCTCQVVFTNGDKVMLSRYIDFEMTNFSQQSTINPVKLAKLIGTNFGREEIMGLTWELGIAFEEIPEDTAYSGRGKAKGLVTYARNHDRLHELMALCQRERPSIEWAKEVIE